MVVDFLVAVIKHPERNNFREAGCLLLLFVLVLAGSLRSQSIIVKRAEETSM